MGLEIHPGSLGVTGVKKVIFTKNAISPSDYMVWPWALYILISWIPSTKGMGQEIHPGSLGVKRSFSPKMLILLQIAWYGHGSHTY